MLFAEILCASQTDFLRACAERHNFGVFKADIIILKEFHNCYRGKAACEIVVCALNYAVFIIEERCAEENNDKSEQNIADNINGG